LGMCKQGTGKKALEPLARNVVCLLLLWDEN